MKAIMKKIERDAIVLEVNGQECKLIMGSGLNRFLHDMMNEGLYVESMYADQQRDLLMASDNPDAEKMLNKVMSNTAKWPDVYQ